MIFVWALTMLAISYYNFALSYKIDNASLDRITISYRNAMLLSSVFRGDGIAYILAAIAGVALLTLYSVAWYFLGILIFYNIIVCHHVRQAYRKFNVQRMD